VLTAELGAAANGVLLWAALDGTLLSAALDEAELDDEA